jgi:diguanylate cyclase (GGDEF)-like protein
VLACRYGGDEFCVILPATGPEMAVASAERLRASIESCANDERAITVSIGYACLAGQQFSSAEKQFDAADAALYSAKQAGRNRVAGFSGRRKDDVPPAEAPAAAG